MTSAPFYLIAPIKHETIKFCRRKQEAEERPLSSQTHLEASMGIRHNLIWFTI